MEHNDLSVKSQTDRYVHHSVTLWNIMICQWLHRQIIMFHSVTLYEMLSVTPSRSLCFTALLCMNMLSVTSSSIVMEHNVTLYEMSLSVTFHSRVLCCHSITLYEMLSVTSSRSLCYHSVTAVWNIKISDSQQTTMFHNITLYSNVVKQWRSSWKSLTTFHTE